jgi:hypothetical protein
MRSYPQIAAAVAAGLYLPLAKYEPTPGDVHVDAALTDFSLAIIQDDMNFQAGRAPVKPVLKQTDYYHIFTPGDFMRDDAVVRRAPGEAAPRSGFTLSNTTYNAIPWWTAVPLSELTAANQDPSIPLDEAATKLLTHRMLIRRERLYATAFLNTDGAWTTDVTGGTDFTQWDDAASDPEKNISDGKASVLLATGYEPNVLEVSFNVHQALKRHPMIKDRYKYTSPDSITAEMIARFFELQEYRVYKAVYNTALEGAAQSNAFVTGKHAVLTYQDGDPSIMSASANAAFVWSGLTGMNDLGIRIDSYYDDDKKEDVVRGEFAFDMKITGADLGYRFKSAVS